MRNADKTPLITQAILMRFIGNVPSQVRLNALASTRGRERRGDLTVRSCSTAPSERDDRQVIRFGRQAVFRILHPLSSDACQTLDGTI